MKYTRIPNITPHYVEFDLLSNSAKKFKDITVIKEFFEIKSNQFNLYHAPTLIPRKYHYIASLLSKFTSKYQTLAAKGISLELIDQNGKCRFYCSQMEQNNKFEEIINRHFASRDWAQVEEILLSAGFQIIKKTEVRQITYRIEKLQASYVLTIYNGRSNLLIEAPDQDKLIKALSIVGFSVEKLKIKDLV